MKPSKIKVMPNLVLILYLYFSGKDRNGQGIKFGS